MATAMAPAQRSVLREGIVAGLIGAAVVAVWFLFFDIARGRPFLTPGVVGALGRSMLGALVWWAILIGNLLASLAMLWYLFRAHRALPRTLVGSWGGVLREGVVAGLIGAVVVALWFFAIDAVQGEPLRTPKLLGTALLRQSAPTAAVLSYTVVHGLAFIVV